MSDANKSTPPWRSEVWRVMSGPEENRQTRWFLATLNDGAMFWHIAEPGTANFVAGALDPGKGVALLATGDAFDPVIEKMDPGSPDDLRAELNYLRAREAHFASVLKVADGGQYRNDWTAPLRRVLDENKALRAEVDALRDGQEAVRLALLACLRRVSGNPHDSPEARAMTTASAVKALNGSVAALYRMRDDALEAKSHAERVAAAILGSSAGRLRYYSVTPDFAEHSSAKLAEEAAQFALDQFCDDAENGWDGDVESIQWGVMLPCQNIAMINEVSAEDDTTGRCARSGADYTCDYELRWVEGAHGAPKPEADGPGLALAAVGVPRGE